MISLYLLNEGRKFLSFGSLHLEKHYSVQPKWKKGAMSEGNIMN